jgi:hypothetical protein
MKKIIPFFKHASSSVAPRISMGKNKPFQISVVLPAPPLSPKEKQSALHIFHLLIRRNLTPAMTQRFSAEFLTEGYRGLRPILNFAPRGKL